MCPTFDKARDMSCDSQPGRRALSADLLGQLGTPERPYRSESIPIILRLLKDEDNGVVLSSVVAVGHLAAVECVDQVVELSFSNDACVRSGVAFSLGRVDVQEAIDGLVFLSNDVSSDVREWVALSLGAHLGHSDAVETLERLVEDECDDVRSEARISLGDIVSNKP